MELDELCEKSHKIAKSKGWWEKERNIPELLCLMHSEISEALEEYRVDQMETYFGADMKPCGFYSELADVVMRIGDIFGAHGKSLEHEIDLKMKYNTTRSYKHGGKKC